MAWLAAPEELRVLPHPIYLTWLASLAAFFIAAAVDRRRITLATEDAAPNARV